MTERDIKSPAEVILEQRHVTP